MAKKNKQEDLLGMAEEEAVPEETATVGLFGDESAEERQESSADIVAESKPARETAPYLVLARKYRPQTFDQIVGQDGINQALRGAIAGGQIANAYLFSGPRGTGKTSTARILAKSLNCKTGPRPDPCGKCDSCRSITAGSSLDVIEIDAASNTGVDNIRDLRTGVVLAPFSRYKVYIVDEVHMLSTAAFNALLKTLEEPPPQVVFVLATTELQKVPETIISRCQAYAFKRFSASEIIAQLDKILTAEIAARDMTVEDVDRFQILELIARHAEGGMRDAQVALDQVLVLAGKKLEFEIVRRFLGSVQAEVLDRFITLIHERKTAELLSTIEELSSSGQDMELFAKSLAEQVRDLLIARTAPGKPELLTVSADRYAAMRVLAEELPVSLLLNFSAAILRLLEEMKASQQQRFQLEFLVIRLTQVNPVDDIEKIVTRLLELEKILAGGPAALSRTPAPAADPQSARADRMESASMTAPEPYPAVGYSPAPQLTPAMICEEEDESFNDSPEELVTASVVQAPVISSGGDLMSRLREATAASNSSLYRTLLDAAVLSYNGDSLVLGVDKSDKFGFAHLDRQSNQQILKEIIRGITGRSISIKVQFAELKKSEGPLPAPAMTPAVPAPTTHVALEQSSTPGAPATETNPLELCDQMTTILRGEALRQFIEKHADVKELVAKVKEAFKVDDSQLAFRRRTI